MIRNAVIHPANEQPLLADLYQLPAASDLCLVCTNLRTLSGTRPTFADNSASYFLFPLSYIRFVEIPPGAMSGAEPMPSGEEVPALAAGQAAGVDSAAPEADLEIDEDFLRRVRDV
jgi:hypothetical protein